MAHDARASSMGTTAWPKRRIPERSPSAPSSAWPSASPVSSTVWCGPVSRSPWTWMSRSRPPWRAMASSRWSKNPTPVWRSPVPVPSSARESETSVSPVTRWMWEVRVTRGAPSTRRARGSPRRGQGYASHPAPEGGRRERRLEASGPPGGQHVVRAGDVVAEGGSGAGPDEHAAGAGHAVGERLGLLADQLEVLRRDLLRNPQTGQGCVDLDRLHLPHPIRHGPDQGRLGRDQPERALWAVLRLCQKVQRDELGVRPGGREHGELARARETIDAHLSEHLPLRLGHPWIAGADDDVDGRNGLGAEGERGDGLRSAHPVHLGDLAQDARGEDHGVRAPSRAGRRADRDLLDTRYPGGHGSHDDGGRIRRPPTRYVDAGAAHRHLGHLHSLPLRQAHRHRLAQLCLRHGPHVCDRRTEAFEHVPLEDADRALELASIDPKPLRSQLGVIEALREPDHGLVAACPHLIEDVAHRPLELGLWFGPTAHPERSLSTIRSISAAFSLCATGLAISRAVQTPISSTTRSPFSSRVRPVAVRSTIPSTRPVSGASSTEPFTSTISAWRPVSAKCRAATRGYFVAIRTRPRRRSADPIGSPSPAATTMRQRA